MARLTEVEIGVNSGQVSAASSNLRDFGNSAEGAGKKTKRLEADLKGAGSGFDQVQKIAKQAIGVFLAFETLNFAADLLKSVMELSDQIDKMSIKTGVGIESLQGLMYAAKLSGVSGDELEKALTKVNIKLGEAATGNKTAAEGFAKFGLSIRSANGDLLSAEQMFFSISDKMSQMTNATDKVALANEMFGSKLGAQLIPFLEAGSAAIVDMMVEADRLGVTMSESTVIAAVALADNIDRMKMAGQGLTAKLLADTIPALLALSDEFIGSANDASTFSTAGEILGNIISGLSYIAIGAVAAFKAVGIAIGGWAAAIMTLLQGDFAGARNIINMMTEDLAKNAATAVDSMKRISVNTEKYARTTREATTATNGLTEETEKGTTATNKAAKAIKEINAHMDEHVKVVMEARKHIEDNYKAYDNLAASLDPAYRKQRELTNAVAILDAALKDQTITIDEYNLRLQQLADKSADTAAAVAHAADPIADAWKGAMERVDTAFADAWKGSFDSFRSFADSLKNAFKQLLAEMAHMAITKPILISLGAGGSIGSAVASEAVGSGGSGGSGIMSTLSNLSSMKTAAAWMTNTAYMANSAAFGATATASQVAALTDAGLVSGQAATGGYLAANAGPYVAAFAMAAKHGPIAGMAAGAATSAIVGGVAGGVAGTGVMAGATGALAGIGPVGWAAMAALAIGGAILGKKKKPSDKLAAGNLDLGTGEIRDIRTKGYREQNVELRDSIIDVMLAAGDSIRAMGGDVSGSFGVAVGDRTGIRGSRNGEAWVDYGKDPKTAIVGMLTDIFKSATGVAQYYTTLILKETDPDRFIGMFSALSQLNSTMQLDPVKAAAEALTYVMPTMTEVYNTQRKLVQDLLQSYDGSLEATQELSAAYSGQQQMAYELAFALGQVATHVKGLFGTLAEEIRQSQLTAEALYKERDQYVDSLVEKLSAAVDPASIASLSTEIERVTRLMWGSLDETQKALQANNFITFLDEVSALAVERTDLALAGLDADNQETKQTVTAALDSAAAKIDAAANALVSAASTIQYAASGMQSALSNIRVSVDVNHQNNQVG